MIKHIIASVLFTALCLNGIAQKQNKPKHTEMYGGLGAGLDYGGIGLRIEYLPVRRLGLFAGAGYNFTGIGVNGGISWNAFDDGKSTPFIMGMYGYNAVLMVKSAFNGNTITEEVYYGPSFGLGYNFLVGREKRNKLSIAAILPIRTAEFKDRYDAFKAAGYTFSPDVSPVLFSIGFNAAGNRKR